MTKENAKEKKRSRRKTRVRGEALTSMALAALSNTALWKEGLTWEKLAQSIGVTRQALESRDELVKFYETTKQELKKDHVSATGKIRRNVEERIAALKNENERLQSQLDRFAERWMVMEQNCLRLQIDPDQVLGTLGSSEGG